MADGPIARPQRPAQPAKARPDPAPMRLAFGLTGLAAASAIITALASPAGADAGAVGSQATLMVAADPPPIVRHVLQYVQLQPGQVAPSQAVVRQAPVPKPRVVVVTTRQSGAP
jgi:hypothetical protein